MPGVCRDHVRRQSDRHRFDQVVALNSGWEGFAVVEGVAYVGQALAHAALKAAAAQ